eukprot:Skav206699  [mRNA]  locus=scaffold99:62199:65052:- [translate_table: standard]
MALVFLSHIWANACVTCSTKSLGGSLEIALALLPGTCASTSSLLAWANEATSCTMAVNVGPSSGYFRLWPRGAKLLPWASARFPKARSRNSGSTPNS